jgi:hypothetical protein
MAMFLRAGAAIRLRLSLDIRAYATSHPTRRRYLRFST